MPQATALYVKDLHKFLVLIVTSQQYWVSYITTPVGSHTITPVV